MNTYILKKADINNERILIDSSNMTLGRLASRVSLMLRGKHKHVYTPFMDCGDHVVILNADKLYITGDRTKRVYYKHTGYIGSMKTTTSAQLPMTELLLRAVRNMMPKNKLSRAQMKKLHIFPDHKHPYGGLKMKELTEV